MSARPASRPRVARPRVVRPGVALLAAAALTLSACSDDPEPKDDAAPQEIEITITDDEVSPLGERFEVEAGQSFPVTITADREGSLHVHTNPEQEWEFTEGTTELDVTIDQPGVAEVELHDPDAVVLQLEVR